MNAHEIQDLAYRTKCASVQLMRYGGVASAELADVLDGLTDLNDDISNGRDPALIQQKIEELKTLLDLIK